MAPEGWALPWKGTRVLRRIGGARGIDRRIGAIPGIVSRAKQERAGHSPKGKGSDWASILAPGPVTTEHLWDQEGPVEVALTTGMSDHAMQRYRAEQRPDITSTPTSPGTGEARGGSGGSLRTGGRATRCPEL